VAASIDGDDEEVDGTIDVYQAKERDGERSDLWSIDKEHTSESLVARNASIKPRATMKVEQ
jgi:hypothetical protein